MSHEELVRQALKDMRDGVTEVDLGKIGLTGEEVTELCEAIKVCTTLLKLTLFDNNLGEAGVREVCDALKVDASVMDVDLSVNKGGDKGLAAVAELLVVNSTITRLGYGGNGVTAAGVEGFADVLRTEPNLQFLDLQFNALGPEGVALVADALKTNDTLLELYLGGNSMGDDGAIELAEMLKVNRSLQRLDVPQNGITGPGAGAFAKALDFNETLLSLYIEDPDVPTTMLRAITSRLEVVKEQADDFGYYAFKALERNVKVRWGRAKLMVVGDGQSAGKSATVRSLLGRSNDKHAEGFEPPVEVDVRVTRVGSDWQELKPEVSDLSELLAKFQYTQKLAARSRNSRRVSRRASRRYSWGTDGEQRKSGRRSLKAALTMGLLSGPKLAVSERQLTRKFISKLKARVEERGERIKDEVSFTVLDFVGQDLFYTLSHVFMSEQGVYLVCFSMVSLRDDEAAALKMLRFWLDAIKLHSPHAEVVLCGTHADRVPRESDHAKMSSKLDSALELDQQRLHRNGRLAFFPVDNMDPEARGAVRSLREALAAAVRGKDYVEREIPLRWALVADELAADNNRSYVRLPLLKKFAAERCGISESDLEHHVLPFLRDAGVILHRTETPVLAERVVTRPGWILDNLSRVLGNPAHRAHREGVQFFGADFPAELETSFQRWQAEAIADKPLLEWLWRGKDVDFFSGLLEHMHLACPSANGSTFMVPSLLPPLPEEERAKLDKAYKGGPLAIVQWEFLPTGIFHRFCTNLMAHDKGRTARVVHLFADAALLDMGGVQVLLLPRPEDHRVLVRFKRADAGAGNAAQRVQRIKASFGTVHTDFMRDTLKPRLLLSADGTTAAGSLAPMDAVMAAAAAKKKKAKTVAALSGKNLNVRAFAPFLL